jgi:hypothetical protein
MPHRHGPPIIDQARYDELRERAQRQRPSLPGLELPALDRDFFFTPAGEAVLGLVVGVLGGLLVGVAGT